MAPNEWNMQRSKYPQVYKPQWWNNHIQGTPPRKKKFATAEKNVSIYPSSVNLIEGCQHLYEGNFFSPILRSVP